MTQNIVHWEKICVNDNKIPYYKRVKNYEL